nr:hypothetical protein [Peptoniphilus harei]
MENINIKAPRDDKRTRTFSWEEVSKYSSYFVLYFSIFFLLLICTFIFKDSIEFFGKLE